MSPQERQRRDRVIAENQQALHDRAIGRNQPADSGPKMFQNPYYQPPAENEPGREGMTVAPETAPKAEPVYEPYKPLPQQDPNNPIDPTTLEFAKSARNLMNTETDITEARRRRLQGIIDQASRPDLESAQKMADYQLKKIFDLNSSPSTALSTAQTQKAYNEIGDNAIMGLTIKAPVQLYTSNVEETDPMIAVANAAKTYADSYGVPIDEIKYQLELDPKTGKLSAASVNKMIATMERRNEVSPERKKAISDFYRTLQTRKKELKEDSTLFDQRTGAMLERPTTSMWASSVMEDKYRRDYDAAKTEWDDVSANSAAIELETKRMAGYGDEGSVSRSVQMDQVQASITRPNEPSTTPATLQNSPEGSKLRPIKLVPGISLADIKAEATETRTVVYVQLADGRVFPIKPE